MTSVLRFSFAPFDRAPDVAEATTVILVDAALKPGARTADLLADTDWALVARAAAEIGFRGQDGESMVFFAGTRRLVFLGVACDGEPVRAIDIGGRAAAAVGFPSRIVIAAEGPPGVGLPALAAAEIALGFRLRSYRFDTYRTRRPEPPLPAERNVAVLTPEPDAARAAFATEAAVAEGVELARSLVNEPANVLTPPEFARRIAGLTEAGLEVEILRAADLDRLGFRALLAVGQGSAHESHVALLRWRGAPDRASAPLAFAGKGVCFDTGGISIKPASDMGEMKGDMAGAACVVGLMLALARRRAPVNAVGAVGLVENMVDGRAQRPGDIVRSLSGQTIEVADTDYEGRLVLADLLWHVQATETPRFMIDLATLTEAVVTAVGRDHAGLFSNDDDLATRLAAASAATGELTWRLPLGPSFDKAMDSKIADVRNLDPDQGGACTAASFIQRFVNKVPWTHLDISGPAQNAGESAICHGWGTGWGVRLLDCLVRDLERG